MPGCCSQPISHNLNITVTAREQSSRQWYSCITAFNFRLPRLKPHRNFCAFPRVCSAGSPHREQGEGAPPPTRPPKPTAGTSSSHPRPKPWSSPSHGAFFDLDREFHYSQSCRSTENARCATTLPKGHPWQPPPAGARHGAGSRTAGTRVGDAPWSLNGLLSPSPAAGAPGNAPGAPLPEPGGMLLPPAGLPSPSPHTKARQGGGEANRAPQRFPRPGLPFRCRLRAG